MASAPHPNVLIIGLCGAIGAGKSTARGALVRAAEAERIRAYALPVAERLKNGAMVLLGLSYEDLHGQEEKETRVEDLDATPRQVLQRLGDHLRATYGPEGVIRGWRKSLLLLCEQQAHLGRKVIIVEDVRFDAEARVIRELGGLIWYIERPGTGWTDASKHVSEQGLTAELIDHILVNDGTEHAFRINVIEAYRQTPYYLDYQRKMLEELAR